MPTLIYIEGYGHYCQGRPFPLTKSMMHLAYPPPHFRRIKKKSSYFRKIYKSPPIFVKFTFLCLIYVFCFSPNLTMMHLCSCFTCWLLDASDCCHWPSSNWELSFTVNHFMLFNFYYLISVFKISMDLI